MVNKRAIFTRERNFYLLFPGLLREYPDPGDFLRVAHCKTNLSYDEETFQKKRIIPKYFYPS